MKKSLKLFTTASLLALPFLANAQVVASGSFTLGDILNMLIRVLVTAPRILVFLAIALILFNIVRYIFKKDTNEAARKEMLSKLGVSILALVIALSIWGIMAIISSTFNLGVGGEINQDFIPSVDLSDVIR